MAPDWLERIVAPLEAGADVAMGFYRPAPAHVLRGLRGGRLAAGAGRGRRATRSCPRPGRWRSGARRSRRPADIPSGLDFGEDMYVNHRWRELGLRMEFVPEALV